MKYILSIVIGFVICVFAQTYISWWWVFAPLVFFLSYFVQYSSARKSFFAGFLMVFICWMAMYLYTDAANNSLLSKKMAEVFSLPNNYLLFMIASILMGIISGFSSLAAYYLQKNK